MCLTLLWYFLVVRQLIGKLVWQWNLQYACHLGALINYLHVLYILECRLLRSCSSYSTNWSLFEPFLILVSPAMALIGDFLKPNGHSFLVFLQSLFSCPSVFNEVTVHLICCMKIRRFLISVCNMKIIKHSSTILSIYWSLVLLS